MLQIGDAPGVISFDDIKVEEVVPGCVNDANSFAADTHGKDTTLDCFREHWNGSGGASDTTKSGSFYALRTFNGAANRSYYLTSAVETDPTFLKRLAGRTVTFGAWVKTSTASHARLGNYDGASYEYSAAYCPGDGDWHWMELTRTFPETAAYPTYARFFFHINVDAATAYFSQPMLVFGSAIGEGNYSRPSGEIVNVEKNIVLQSNVSPLAADDKILNLEALSDGKVPKGAKAVQLSTQIKNSAAAADQGSRWGATSGDPQPLDLFNYPYVTDFYNQANGIVACDSNGDIYQEVTESGATLNSLYQYVRAVHLR